MSSSGFQIREALEVQLDVQRRLHEQLEVLVGLFPDDLLRGVIRFIQDHDDQTFEWPSLQFHLPILLISLTFSYGRFKKFYSYALKNKASSLR